MEPSRRRRAVSSGTITTSSWSRPKPLMPLGARVPTTVKLVRPMRTVSPMPVSLPNNSRRTVSPRITTFSPLKCWASKAAPLATCQPLICRKSAWMPCQLVDQLVSANTTWLPPRSDPDTSSTSGTSSRIASMSPSVRVKKLLALMRTPPMLREPCGPMSSFCAPSPASWRSISAWVPWPTDTITITAAMPMITPSEVRALRIQLPRRAKIAVRSTSMKLMRPPRHGWPRAAARRASRRCGRRGRPRGRRG